MPGVFLLQPAQAILQNADGVALAVVDGNDIPAYTPGLITLVSDGLKSRYLKGDTSGRLLVVGAGTAGAPTGGLLTIQGDLAGTPVPSQITQGGNAALVKNSSPGPTDYGLVVRLVNTTGAGADVNVNGWFGVQTPTVGQKAMVASIPIVVASDQTPIPVSTSPGSAIPGIGVGYVTTTTATPAAVRATAYTEQTTDAQRSIASASANDAAAGTGARTVKLTYYTAAFAGPYTETLTLNGTTGVNTVATNICYIEKIEVLTAGSGGSNAGIITLYSAINKGGVAIGTIAVGDNRTFWAHHYVPTGKVLHITSQCVGHNGTTAGSGGLFVLRAQALGVSGAVDVPLSDFVRLYGQSSTVTRNYGTALKLAGPARLTAWVSPEGASTVVYRAALDYYEDNT